MGSVLSIAVVTGNPKPASRTLGVATAVARALAGGLCGGVNWPLGVGIAGHVTIVAAFNAIVVGLATTRPDATARGRR